MDRQTEKAPEHAIVVLGTEPKRSLLTPGHASMPQTQTQKQSTGAVRGSVDPMNIEAAINQVDNAIRSVDDSFQVWGNSVNCSPRVHALALESTRILNEYRRELQFDLRSYSATFDSQK